MNRWDETEMNTRTIPTPKLAERKLSGWLGCAAGVVVAFALMVAFAISGAAEGTTNILFSAADAQAVTNTEAREISGWTLHVSKSLLTTNAQATARALELLESQLGEIVRNVPSSAVMDLRQVRLWISPEYPGVNPRAEYHPNADWLREHGRNPAMAKGVEFTNVRIFEAESRRMPNFTLHELAHAYHDRVLPGGFDNKQIKAAYEKAKAGGKYDNVEQRCGDGRTAVGRAYAMTDPQEYFAESTEAFFSTNDFFPFVREELRRHDPEMFALLEKLWSLSGVGLQGNQFRGTNGDGELMQANLPVESGETNNVRWKTAIDDVCWPMTSSLRVSLLDRRLPGTPQSSDRRLTFFTSEQAH